jgi:hypothetical protein
MASCDGLPFRLFVLSPDTQESFMNMGYSSIPKSKHTIKRMVMDHGKKIRSFVMGEMNERKKKMERS